MSAWPVEYVALLERYQHVKQRNRRPARLDQQTRRFWLAHTRIWRWLPGDVDPEIGRP